MNNQELINALRNTSSRSKRTLLDMAADALENQDALLRANEELKPSGGDTSEAGGEWIPVSDGDMAEYSECGECFETSESGGMAAFERFRQFYKFCPNCGAKMDGGDWISVKDRLPENRGEVLLAVKIVGLPFIRVGWYGPMDGRWYFLGAGRAKDVTHWMPLPEPPKEAE